MLANPRFAQFLRNLQSHEAERQAQQATHQEQQRRQMQAHQARQHRPAIPLAECVVGPERTFPIKHRVVMCLIGTRFAFSKNEDAR